MNGAPLIEMSNVAVPYRRNSDLTSIEGLNWTVHDGDFWIVGGLQGSGKSDLVFMLGGLTKPAHGAYSLYGQDMTARFGDEFLTCRRRVGLVFDDSRLLNHLTIAENIALPARYHHDLHAADVTEWVGELMHATGVTEFASNTPSVIAWHWRRRAALARALALRPELLFLENPLRGLDGRQIAWWVEFVKRLSRGHDLMRGRATTIIATTDEFRPWRNTGPQFATLEEKKFVVMGDNAPEDDAPLRPVTVGEVN